MSLFTKKGNDALNSATANDGAAKESPIVSLKTGTSYKVGIKSIEDVAEYYGYSIYKKVNTFVPKNPADRNAKGFITANPTVWDRAAELLYGEANAAKEGGASDADVKPLTDEAYLYRGKPKFLRAFFDLDTGKDIVIDFSPKQEKTIKAVIQKYANKLGKIAFELSKSGESTNAVVALSPIIDMDEDLTDKQRENYAKLGAAPFDMESLETCLYVADEAEQIKNLVIAGFDIGRLGLTYGGDTAAAAASAPKQPEADGESIKPIDPNAPAPNLNF
ncbi:hypothetical protein LOZ80_15195 [Paenibacillus sp. HWE-109]|uniref:hypothetical protein n=1 Tax=Paenibacillus sp. HWE-109 TaxID=1306526 RepID=UPI001EDCC14A|nr:hypothetical protein [Paenibacillus sp. HWE-109]UKS30206.1 hypothetical protein LOZ80_15195 [Paenibacillus sp. HWE-109]